MKTFAYQVGNIRDYRETFPFKEVTNTAFSQYTTGQVLIRWSQLTIIETKLSQSSPDMLLPRQLGSTSKETQKL